MPTYKPGRMTLKKAKATVRDLGFGLSHNANLREFKVIVPGNPDATYFTDDLQDAVDTARAMALSLKPWRDHEKE